MTQGEEHRHGASSGELGRNLELSHRSDSAETSSSLQAMSEVLLPPCHPRLTNQTQPHAAEDAKNLLQFVHHASCDIKAALDQGNYGRKHYRQHSPNSRVHSDSKISCDDRSSRKDPSPVRRISPAEAMLSQQYHRHSHHLHHNPCHPPHHQPSVAHDRDHAIKEELDGEVDDDDAPLRRSHEIFLRRHDLNLSVRDRVTEQTNRVDSELKGVDPRSKDGEDEKRRVTNGTQSRDKMVNTRQNGPENLDLFSYVDLLRENSLKQNNENKQDKEGGGNSNEADFPSLRGNFEEKGAIEPGENCDKSDKINNVPLRKRRLPASFWQEPKGKSDNHRIVTRPSEHALDGQPRSFVHHPGLSLFGQLKLPLPSPLSPGHFDFDFGLGRHFCADKNPFVYPSTSSASPFLNLNLPYRPHLPLTVPHGVDDRHRHGLPMSPCGNNVCMCHLQNLAACSSNPCEPASPTTSGLFTRNPSIPPISPLDTTTSPALVLNRWSAMQQSMDTTPDLLRGYPSPRVLKPIPTKSLTSYPPRFHPIFT